MNRPYPAESLDNVIKASQKFKKNYPNDHFSAGNLGGKERIPPDEAINGVLTKKMKYIAHLDLDLMEYLGFGSDDIQYFELGPQAGAFMANGGFKNYFEKMERRERTEKLRLWLPILISFLALIVAVLSWTASVNKNVDKKDLKDLKLRVNQLEFKYNKNEVSLLLDQL